jgi:serine protease inhibitor
MYIALLLSTFGNLLPFVQVDMMSKRFKAAEQSAPGARKVQYSETSKYQAVRLPYKGSTISAFIVLPSEQLAVQGIAAAAAQLDVAELLDAGKYRNVGPAGLDVQLPRFKVKTQPTSLKKVRNPHV